MATTTSRNGMFRRAFDAIVRARQIEAQRHFERALLRMDDETLRSYGVTRAELLARHGV